MFLDANIFIHSLITSSKEGNASVRFLERVASGEQKAVTSLLVFNEVMHFLIKKERLEDAKHFWRTALSFPNLTILPIDSNCANYIIPFLDQGLQTTDAFHAAAMKANGISTICSYDKGFDKIKGIKRQEPK